MATEMTWMKEAWAQREGPAVLTTVDDDRKPNSVYVSEIDYDEQMGFVVADNYFDKTRANIKAGSRGAVLFITKAGKSYQAKGSLTYHTEGPAFERMQVVHDPKNPGVAATVLQIETVYSGAEKLM